MGRFKEMDIEQQERILAAHKEDALRGATIRTLAESLHDLIVARQALNKDRIAVAKERLDVVIDGLNALLQRVEQN